MDTNKPEHYEIFDLREGKYGLRYRVKSVDAAVAKANEIGVQRFHGVTDDKSIEDLKFLKKVGRWLRQHVVKISAPRVDVSALGPLGKQIDKSRDMADRLGVTANIQKQAYAGKTAMQIAHALDSRLGQVKDLVAAKNEHPFAETVEFVRHVHVSLGIAHLLHSPPKGLERVERNGDLIVAVQRQAHAEVGLQELNKIDRDSAANERQVVGEMYKHANAALGEIMAREPQSVQEAERIVDGHVAQQRGACPGARPVPVGMGGERVRSYVQDKFDEIGVGKGNSRDLRPVSGRVVAVTDKAVRIERNDKSVAEVDRTKLPHVLSVGEQVMVTYDGAGNAALRTLTERAQDKAMGRELAR